MEVVAREERLSKPREAEWQAQRDQILDESTAAEVPWAGHYSRSLAFTGSAVFVAPRSGFAFGRFGCSGASERNLGSVETKGREMFLFPAWHAPKDEEVDLPERLLIVPWGERTYLLEEGDLIRFCNEVNSGYEPRSEECEWGWFLLKTGAIAQRPEGLPDLPHPYRGYLLEHPLEVRVTSLGEWSRPDSNRLWETTVTLDIGSNGGIFEGMKLFDAEYACEVLIDKTTPESSRGTVTSFGGNDGVGVGTVLTAIPGGEYRWMMAE